jgi:hypothetical protein
MKIGRTRLLQSTPRARCEGSRSEWGLRCCKAVLSSGLVVYLVGAGCLPAAEMRKPSEHLNATPNMKLQLKLIQPTILVGESLNVDVTLTNDTSSPLKVPSARATSQFEYVVRPAMGTGKVIVLSAQRATQAASRGRAPSPPSVSESLPPGQALVYKEDLAAYAGSGLGAGRYLLSVVHGVGSDQIESQAVPLVVLLPDVASLAIATSPRREAGLFFVHRDRGQTSTIFQQECTPGKPLQGAAERRLSVPAPFRVTGVAGAFKGPARTWERWYAWLRDDGALGGGLAWGRASYSIIEPQALGLKSEQLFSMGWQSSPKAGIFAVLGLDAESSRRQLALVTLRAKEALRVLRVPLDGTFLPEAWAVNSLVGGEADSLKFDLIMADSTDGRIRISSQRFTTQPLAIAPQTTLFEHDKPLLALSLDEPSSLSGAHALNALFEVVGVKSNPEVRLVRMQLDGGQKPAEWLIPFPEHREKVRPSAWTVGSSGVGDAVILAKLEDILVVRRVPSGTGWTALSSGCRQAQFLRVLFDESAAWAFWWNPASGFQAQMIP